MTVQKLTIEISVTVDNFSEHPVVLYVFSQCILYLSKLHYCTTANVATHCSK